MTLASLFPRCHPDGLLPGAHYGSYPIQLPLDRPADAAMPPCAARAADAAAGGGAAETLPGVEGTLVRRFLFFLPFFFGGEERGCLSPFIFFLFFGVGRLKKEEAEGALLLRAGRSRCRRQQSPKSTRRQSGRRQRKQQQQQQKQEQLFTDAAAQASCASQQEHDRSIDSSKEREGKKERNASRLF